MAVRKQSTKHWRDDDWSDDDSIIEDKPRMSMLDAAIARVQRVDPNRVFKMLFR